MTEALLEKLTKVCGKHGFTPVEWVPITRFAPDSKRRKAFRARLENGSSIKARWWSDHVQAERLKMLRRDSSIPFLSSILAFDEGIILEEWIEGESLCQLSPEPEDVMEAARILAELHSTTPDFSDWRESARGVDSMKAEALKQLVELHHRGVLTLEKKRQAEKFLERAEPDHAAIGYVHGDFCGQNLVKDNSGQIWVVDNELLDLGCLDYDLGFCWFRWPLSGALWQLFFETYRGSTDRRVSAVWFWRLIAATKSVYFHTLLQPEGLKALLPRFSEVWNQPKEVPR